MRPSSRFILLPICSVFVLGFFLILINTLLCLWHCRTASIVHWCAIETNLFPEFGILSGRRVGV